MAGKKGRSGRKPNKEGVKHRAVNLYIPMVELDVGTGFGQGKARYEWVPDDWFRQFKRIHGSRWQEQVRKSIRYMVNDYEERKMWPCKCEGRINKYHRTIEGSCPRCHFVPGQISRYKTESQARIHSTEEPKQKPLSLCPVCKNPLSLKLDIHGRKVSTCEVCR